MTGLSFTPWDASTLNTRTPAFSLVAISAWSIVLALSGSYDQLYAYVMFMMVLSSSPVWLRFLFCAANTRRSFVRIVAPDIRICRRCTC